MTNTHGYAMQGTSTRRERFWRALGYRFHLGDEPENTEAKTGWFKTGVLVTLGWHERLLLLVSGRLKVELTNYSDGQPENIVSRVDITYVPPLTKA